MIPVGENVLDYRKPSPAYGGIQPQHQHPPQALYNISFVNKRFLVKEEMQK
jgi:hypothetical protein